MANWTVTATASAIDTSGSSANVNVTFVAINSVTNETQTRVVPSNSWTTAQMQVFAQSLIQSLIARDAALAVAQAAVNANTVLATG